MEYDYLRQLDDFFAAQYSDYVRIAAIEGYRMPEMLTVGQDGNIVRKDSKYMRLCYQSDPAAVLTAFKATLADTEFTFDFTFPSFFSRKKRKGKDSFAGVLGETLKRYDETPKSVGEKLSLEEPVWNGIVKGKLYPEKNTVMAIALVCRMNMYDVNALLAAGGFFLSAESVRDVVFEYLIMQKIFNEEMRDRCLAEYKIDTIPFARKTAPKNA